MQEYFTMSKTSYELENAELWVQLDSNGGSVSDAMQIGRVIRKYDGTTWMFLSKCFSSCSLILSFLKTSAAYISASKT